MRVVCMLAPRENQRNEKISRGSRSWIHVVSLTTETSPNWNARTILGTIADLYDIVVIDERRIIQSLFYRVKQIEREAECNYVCRYILKTQNASTVGDF